MKRTIAQKIEKFEHKYLQDCDCDLTCDCELLDAFVEMDQTRSVEMTKEIGNLKDRFRNLENEVNTLNLLISDEWGNESKEELTKLIEKNLTDKLTYLSKINIAIHKGYDIIESSAHENKFNS